MDINLHFTETGSGEPIILLHGNGEDSSYFAPQIECFSKMFKVLALDTRGHGKSPRGTAPFTLEQFVEDLHTFMDQRDIASAHILGFSDGANIAILFALAHPNRVRSLVLNGGNLFPEGLTEEVRLEDTVAFEAAQQSGDTHTLELLRLMMDEPHIAPSSLAALHIPTLVVAGTHDMILESHTRLIAESIPNAQLAFLEGSHFVSSENPEAFNRIVTDFWQANRKGNATAPLEND